MKLSLDYKINLNDYINTCLSKNLNLTILYADFNVVNYLYENNVKVPDSVLIYPDSTAVHLMLWIKGFNISKAIVSTDIQEKLLNSSVQKRLKVFFFGDSTEVLSKLKSKISNKYPDLTVSGIQQGYYFQTHKVLEEIRIGNPDIIFVGLGVGKQELWILENHEKIDSLLIISVGGWFRFLSGTKKRAPIVFRKLHIEWLFKIITDFKRLWKRYLFGVPKFFYRVLTNKIQFELISSDE